MPDGANRFFARGKSIWVCSNMTTLMYRRRAADYLQASQENDDPKDRLELLRVALAWAELARLAESNQRTTQAGDVFKVLASG
jgi:hypothetical protein